MCSPGKDAGLVHGHVQEMSWVENMTQGNRKFTVEQEYIILSALLYILQEVPWIYQRPGLDHQRGSAGGRPGG